MQEIEIEDLSLAGEGIGKCNGLTTFVEGALPGEKVKAVVIEKRNSFAKSRLLEIVRASTERRAPPCPVFEKCGGCQIMHLEYQAQLKVKEKRIRDAFFRIGKIVDFEISPCVASPKPLHYRNKIQLPVGPGNTIGLYAKGSHEIVPFHSCLIHNEVGEKVLWEVKKYLVGTEIRHIFLRTSRKEGKVLVVLITKHKPTPALRVAAKNIMAIPEVKGVMHGLNAKENNVVRADAYSLMEGEGYLEEELLGINVRLSPAAFFQVNPWQASTLYAKALTLAEIKGSEKVLDAYCGIGLFTCLLAKHAKEVVGIESVQEAVDDAKYNASINGVNVKFHVGKTEDLIGNLERQDVVFLNPPRKGAEEVVLAKVLEMSPTRIIYTSCDPATLARDAAILHRGGYTKISLFPFDMFPETMHVETVALFLKFS